MTFRQKLEICTGLATPIVTLLYICLGPVRTVLHFNDFTSTAIAALLLFALLWLSSLGVAFGAYNDAYGSGIGADILYISGLIVIIFSSCFGFVVLVYGWVFYGLLIYSSVMLSVITIILSLYSREKAKLSIR
jgi:hypothetical protein